MFDYLDWLLMITYLIIPIIFVLCLIIMLVTELKAKPKLYLNKVDFKLFKVYRLNNQFEKEFENKDVPRIKFDYVGVEVGNEKAQAVISKKELENGFIKVKGMK